MTSPRPAHRHWIASMHLLIGALTLVGTWLGLPARWLWVDVPATAIGVALIASAAALWTQRQWAGRFARWVAVACLALGCAAFTALAWSASHLAGLYGPVGAGGALLLGAIAALIVPYLVGAPALQLWLLREPK